MQALHRLLLPSLLTACGSSLAAVEGPRVNEIIANSGGAVVDSIELSNPTGATVDLGGWWLSDDVDALQSYRIPDGTSIPAGSYLVLLEDDDSDPDNNAELPPQYFGNSFSLSSRGEQVWLSAPDQVYRHGFSFGPSDVNVSLGPVVLSTGAETIMPLQTVTLGAANAAPAVGPVVISEIMYHPAASGLEFIELLNIGSTTVALADTVNGNAWELDGAQFFFPLDAELAPGRTALVVEGEPAAFRSVYGVAESVVIYGPMAGGLKNSGERLSLRRPLPPPPRPCRIEARAPRQCWGTTPTPNQPRRSLH